MFKYLILLVALSCIGCSSNHKVKHSVWGRYNPSFEIDDIKDGVFPNKSPRIGEKADPFRAAGGMRHRFNNGCSIKWGLGRRNKHIGEAILEVEQDL